MKPRREKESFTMVEDLFMGYKALQKTAAILCKVPVIL
jgi:hypothetical protein